MGHKIYNLGVCDNQFNKFKNYVIMGTLVQPVKNQKL